MLLENELKQDAIKDREVISVQLISQPLEKCSLLGRKHFAVEVVPIRNLNPTAVAARTVSMGYEQVRISKSR